MYKYLIFFLLHCSIIYAQKHDNNWIFGYDNTSNYDSFSLSGGVRKHFEKGFPEYSLEFTRVDYGIYGGTMSDSSGNMIFHTNGFKIYNPKHKTMENGDTINPGYYWNEYHNLGQGYPVNSGTISIPAPGFKDCYYLIHSAANDDINSPIIFPKLYYSFIDMSANNGLGKVVSKNQILAEGEVPFPVAIKHGNGRDWWVLVNDFLSKTCKTYLIDPDGIHLLYEQGIVQEMIETSNGYGGSLASQNGDLFCYNNRKSGLWVFDFDRCGGLLSNPRTVVYASPFYASTMCFSRSGRFLYLATTRVIYQMAVSQLDSVSSYVLLDSIANYDGGSAPFPPFRLFFYFPQLGPDGKIYYITLNSTMASHVINKPDLPNPVCDFAQAGSPIPRFRDGTWCRFPAYRLGKLEGSDCDSLGFKSDDPAFRTKRPPKNISYNGLVKKLHLYPGFIQNITAEPIDEAEDMFDLGFITRELRQKYLNNKKQSIMYQNK